MEGINGGAGEGVASDADILAVKVFDDEGETTSGIISESIIYAVDMGAGVIAMPFSLFPISTRRDEAGTSFSAAFVAGITALMLSENPGMTREDVLEELKALTVGLGDAEEDVNIKESKIMRVDINDEVVSMQEAQRKNRADFTGYTVEMNIDIRSNELVN